MSEVVKDSAIKLFGRTISLPRNNEVSATATANGSSELPPPEDCSDHCPPSSSSSPREVSSTREHEAERHKEAWMEELTSAQDDEASHQTREELKSPASSSSIFENPKTPSTERETCLLKSSKIREEIDTREEKSPKKPEKILACPRCKSMDTKFCYYNNYNVNQPRHFCKNCLRYWTAGGTMRNVPVGAGRRKNKNASSSSSFASHYRQIMLPETLQTPNGSLHTAVLTFGSDSPHSDSLSSVFNLAEKSQNGVLNGFYSPTKQSNKNNNDDDEDDKLIGASVIKASTPKRDSATSCSHEESVDKDKSYQAFTPQLCFQGSSSTSTSTSPSSSWSYPWNPAMSPTSAFCQQSYHPVSFYPTPPFWGCMPPSWSLHSLSPQSCVNYQTAPSSSPNSPTLGKHSRDGNILFQTNSQKEKPAGSETNNNTEKNSTSSVLLIPKTLRIDDPTEAAKSSIWSTLGIKNEKGNGGGLFKAFASKGGDEKNHVVVEASPVLQANPAALTRSLIFHERT